MAAGECRKCVLCDAPLDPTNDAGWRWNGENWEHKCSDLPPQCGHVGYASGGVLSEYEELDLTTGESDD